MINALTAAQWTQITPGGVDRWNWLIDKRVILDCTHKQQTPAVSDAAVMAPD